ncbi:apoptosis facilitator Bcl-2-like protein 14 [Gadus macrocephalus]|uniref:apoptosis facilitator Bcl-2-like protein 14 n=1 Tax=Gadus macrocephalus TaxID=80720 RepID=UPI0028CB7969|nr:apoptosis facilitator Bcl-2-like protein 14 [Gadus macrocephalus]XP_059916034.1 apoptosis facilitator Bcl-2-like protein 14 [Gadus macrocephalus]
MNQKIQQNEELQQLLQGAFSYSLFQRLMAALQGAPPASEARLRKEQIAWVFEVTDRLSTIDQIPKRRALSFGSRFLRQNHSDWVQQHGGWEGVLPVKGEHGLTCTSTDLS